jgi:hypothetical protein
VIGSHDLTARTAGAAGRHRARLCQGAARAGLQGDSVRANVIEEIVDRVGDVTLVDGEASERAQIRSEVQDHVGSGVAQVLAEPGWDIAAHAAEGADKSAAVKDRIADYKGEFMLADRRYCYPLTITDFASRYVFACEALATTKEAYAFSVFEAVFKEFGLPKAIRTPFWRDHRHGS